MAPRLKPWPPETAECYGYMTEALANVGKITQLCVRSVERHNRLLSPKLVALIYDETIEALECAKFMVHVGEDLPGRVRAQKWYTNCEDIIAILIEVLQLCEGLYDSIPKNNWHLAKVQAGAIGQYLAAIHRILKSHPNNTPPAVVDEAERIAEKEFNR